MNEKLVELITPDTVLSYANACIEVRKRLLFLEKENYKQLIIPSRGAYPFYQGALQSNHLSTVGEERISFYNKFQLLLLPYTADWGNDTIGEIDISSKQVRKFWTKILADFLKKETSIFTSYYQELVKLIGERYTVNTTNLLPRDIKNITDDSEKFIFIDTAISGRAICEIIDSFHECNLTDYKIILIVDCNGERLREEYESKINTEIANERLFRVNVEKIFTEDASPILNSGIASVVFPSLIEQSYYDIKTFGTEGFVGAGMWFIDSASHLKEYNGELNGVRGIISTLIFHGLMQFEVQENKWFDEHINHSIKEALGWLGGFNLFDRNSTKSLIYDRMLDQGIDLQEDVDISSSHVVRIDIEESERAEFIKRVNKNFN